MKKDQLEALIIDKELGELPEEVSSLLDAYLDSQKEARAEAEEIRSALDLTRQTVVESPEMFRAPSPSGADIMGRFAVLVSFFRSRQVAMAFLIVLSAAAGFFLKGNLPSQKAASSPMIVEKPAVESNVDTSKSIWASYRIDDGGNPVLLATSVTPRP